MILRYASVFLLSFMLLGTNTTSRANDTGNTVLLRGEAISDSCDGVDRCSQSSPAADPARDTTVKSVEPFHVYAPSRTTGKLLIVRVAPNGKSVDLDLAKQIDLGFPAGTITAHPEEPLLYVVASRGEENNTRGALILLERDGSYVSQKPLRLKHGYAYLSLDRANRFLLGANYAEGFVDVHALDENGIPGECVTALDEGRRNAHCILPTPDNRFVYIPYVKDSNAILQYEFDAATGDLSSLTPRNANPPVGTGPRHIAYHPSKPIIYFSNEQHLGVSAYDITESGALKLRDVCDAVAEDESKTGVSSSDIVITPDGRFLFAGIRGHQRDFDWISRYRVDENGNLELLGLTPADKIPWGLALSPDGRYLCVTAHEGGTLTVLRVGEDGSLTKAGSLDWDKRISDLVTR